MILTKAGCSSPSWAIAGSEKLPMSGRLPSATKRNTNTYMYMYVHHPYIAGTNTIHSVYMQPQPGTNTHTIIYIHNIHTVSDIFTNHTSNI